MAYIPAQATPSKIPELIRYLFRELQRVGQEFYSISPQEWIGVTFENSWVNWGSPYNECQYRTVGRDVEIRGKVKTGLVATVIFTLPEDLRPVNYYLIDIISGGTIGRIDIRTDGSIYVVAGSGASYLSLDGIRFSLD